MHESFNISDVCIEHVIISPSTDIFVTLYVGVERKLAASPLIDAKPTLPHTDTLKRFFDFGMRTLFLIFETERNRSKLGVVIMVRVKVLLLSWAKKIFIPFNPSRRNYTTMYLVPGTGRSCIMVLGM
jgi:hypothetical protein